MNMKLQIFIAIVILIALCGCIYMVRKKSLELRYALIWILVGIGILLLDIFPGILTFFANLIGVASPMNMLFFAGFCFALLIIFSLTITVSKMSVQVKQLTQEMALLKEKQRDEHVEN